MRIWKEVFRQTIPAMIIFVIMCAVNAAVFVLYGIFIEPFIYASILCLVFLILYLIVSYFREKQRSAERRYTLNAILSEWQNLPESSSLCEEDYADMIDVLGRQLEKIQTESLTERQDMIDYYTAWVHQIKTPIAVMRLKLSEDTPEHHALRVELTRIEQYAEMALQYIRIGSGTNDLVIREYKLDDLIKPSFRKLAPQFVEKKLKLDYEPSQETVITDEKWFACIMDQLLSNAVKYTEQGMITIRLENGLLKVSDTGIGIAPEDLPRIFEKGYTGINGRMIQHSSGLGLYLAGKAANLLAIPLKAESKVGEGSTFTLDLREKMK